MVTGVALPVEGFGVGDESFLSEAIGEGDQVLEVAGLAYLLDEFVSFLAVLHVSSLMAGRQERGHHTENDKQSRFSHIAIGV